MTQRVHLCCRNNPTQLFDVSVYSSAGPLERQTYEVVMHNGPIHFLTVKGCETYLDATETASAILGLPTRNANRPWSNPFPR